MPIEDFIKRLITREKKVKEVQNPGVIGHYDSKPFHNFKYALIYAKEICILETEEVVIFTRNYKETTFVNVLVSNEEYVDIHDYHYKKIREEIKNIGLETFDKSVTIVAFEHYNQKTVDLCRSFGYENSKTTFEQALIYNARLVQMDYYRPVPKHYSKMYDLFCEDIYFDLAFIDSDKV